MTARYSADSPCDIADVFELYASDQIASKRWQTTQRAKRDCEIRAEVWRLAAADLRITEFKELQGMTYNQREAVAVALWRQDAPSPALAVGRTFEHFNDLAAHVKAEWRQAAEAAITAYLGVLKS